MIQDSKLLNTYGPVEGLLLLGGGRLLRRLTAWAKSVNLPIKVLTSPRHASDIEDGLSLAEYLTQNATKHLVVEQISDSSVVEFVSDTTNYLYLSLGAAWIFKVEVIKKVFNDQLFNLHGTRIPQNRGGGGFSWQIMMGNRFGFCVLHKVDGGVDTGDIIESREFIYPPSARIPRDFENIYIDRNLDFVTQFIEKHRNYPQQLMPIRQSEWFSSYWPRLNTELNGYIDWNLSSAEIERFICAFDEPYKGASTFIQNKKVFLKKVCLSAQDGHFHSFQQGLIYRKSRDWICVAVKGTTLIVEEVFDESGKSIIDQIKVGDRFYTPQSFLEQAKDRPVYTATGLKSS